MSPSITTMNCNLVSDTVYAIRDRESGAWLSRSTDNGGYTQYVFEPKGKMTVYTEEHEVLEVMVCLKKHRSKFPPTTEIVELNLVPGKILDWVSVKPEEPSGNENSVSGIVDEMMEE